MTKTMFLITLKHSEGARLKYKACGINADDAKRKILKEFPRARVLSCITCYEYED